MGANRAIRRQQEREQLRQWKNKGTYEQLQSLQRNGITEKDLDKSYQDGYGAGYKYAATAFFRLMYAAIAKELHENGNTKDEIITFLVNVDHRVSVMFDAEEEIQAVYDLIGVRLNINEQIERVEVV